MPHRILHGLGQVADLFIFGSAFGVIAGRLVGLNISEIGALMTGVAALMVAAGRLVRHIAESRNIDADTEVKKTFVNPEVYQMLANLKCWNAPDCPSREIFKPEDKEGS